MAFSFKSPDEINTFLFKDTTPLDYCKSIIAYTVSQIRAYLHSSTGGKSFRSLDFFTARQCAIYLKNNTVILWSIETPLEAVVLPEADDIVYVHFSDTIPFIMTKEQAAAYGIDEEAYRHLTEYQNYNVCDLAQLLCDDDRQDIDFDSIRGAYSYGDEYGKAVSQNEYHQRENIWLEREWTDYSAQLNITQNGYHGTYFAGTMDGAIGGLVAEQILMSNEPCSRSLQYGKRRYKPLVVYAPIPQENRDAFYDEAFLKTAESYCSDLISRLSLDAEGRCSGGFRYIRVKAVSVFIYMYAHSLLRTSHAANFSIIEPVFTDYLKKQSAERWIYEDEILPEIQAVCRADYFQKPRFSNLTKPLEHFQAAVWALTNSRSYMEAMQNILEFVSYQHDKKLAVILTGIFAGIYYQHYDIPKNLLTANRYYGRFSMSIVPLTHPVYKGKRH